MSFGDPIGGNPLTFPAYGSAIEDNTGWGVVLAGDQSIEINTGSWSGTLSEILEQMGTESGFDVSIDESTKVITLTGL